MHILGLLIVAFIICIIIGLPNKSQPKLSNKELVERQKKQLNKK